MRILIVSGVSLCAWAQIAPATAASFSTIINIPTDVAPSSIGSDTQLNLSEGGSIGDSFVAGASDGSSTNVEINITGGVVGEDFAANSGSTINISGGNIGTFLEANSGSVVNISGGRLDGFTYTYSGSIINISGGILAPLFSAGPGSVVNISGGRLEGLISTSGIMNVSGGVLGEPFSVRASGSANISGGQFARDFRTTAGSAVNLIGGEFQLDGVPVPGLASPGNSVGLNLPDGSFLTGTLTDGSVFIFTTLNQDDIADGTLTLTVAPLPAASPGVINVPSDPAPSGLRAGQTLNLADGGDLGINFAAVDAALNIAGGTVRQGLEASIRRYP